MDGDFLYDLGDPRCVRITTNGWKIENAPIIFRRYAHQLVQVDPVPGGDAWELFQFLRIPKDQQLITQVYIHASFIPNIPHPVFYFHGAQGTGKTTAFKMMKKLIDPSVVEAIIHPSDANELVQLLTHHHMALFDNLGTLPDWMSDILSQVCTGSVFSKRMLYSDDDDVIYSIQRCVGLNGINLLVGKPDLMDRSILMALERTPDGERLEERDLFARFEQARPRILGGILDTISKAMKIYPEVRLPFLYRMADFTRWGYAIAQALGNAGKQYLMSYGHNVERQTEEVIDRNTLAQAITQFMAERTEWQGLVSEAYDTLYAIASPRPKDRTFPAYPNKLRHHLKILESTLRQIGITFEYSAHSDRGTFVTFLKGCGGSSVSSSTKDGNGKQLELLKIPPDDSPEDTLTVPLMIHGVSSSPKFLKTKRTDNPDDKFHTSQVPSGYERLPDGQWTY